MKRLVSDWFKRLEFQPLSQDFVCPKDGVMARLTAGEKALGVGGAVMSEVEITAPAFLRRLGHLFEEMATRFDEDAVNKGIRDSLNLPE